jgi:hypothetical protein
VPRSEGPKSPKAQSRQPTCVTSSRQLDPMFCPPDVRRPSAQSPHVSSSRSRLLSRLELPLHRRPHGSAGGAPTGHTAVRVGRRSVRGRRGRQRLDNRPEGPGDETRDETRTAADRSACSRTRQAGGTILESQRYYSSGRRIKSHISISPRLMSCSSPPTGSPLRV